MLIEVAMQRKPNRDLRWTEQTRFVHEFAAAKLQLLHLDVDRVNVLSGVLSNSIVKSPDDNSKLVID
jgi:hypothetical protein